MANNNRNITISFKKDFIEIIEWLAWAIACGAACYGLYIVVPIISYTEEFDRIGGISIGLTLAVIPYVIARAVSKLFHIFE